MTIEGDVQRNGVAFQHDKPDKLWGKHTVWGKDGEHNTPMVTRYWFGRLRYHIFWRGDNDPDAHDHPWDFWTWPLNPYVEEVIYSEPMPPEQIRDFPLETVMRTRELKVVPAFQWSYRRATYTHRVLGRYSGSIMTRGTGHIYHGCPADSATALGVPMMVAKPIRTIVWRSAKKRSWGFLKHRDGRWCWVAWKDYVYGTGKSAPCE